MNDPPIRRFGGRELELLQVEKARPGPPASVKESVVDTTRLIAPAASVPREETPAAATASSSSEPASGPPPPSTTI